MLMIKKVLTGFILLAGLTSGYAQNSNLVLGVEGGMGLSIATAIDSNKNEAPYKNGLATLGGLSAEYRMSEMLSFRSGLYYESKTSKFSSSFSFFGVSFGIEGKSRFGYLTVPLMLNFSHGEKVRFIAGAGATLSFLLSQQTEVTTTGIISSTTTSNDKDEFKPVDIGLAFNIGVGIPIGEKAEFMLLARDHIGVANMMKDANSNGELKYNSLYLTLGIGFFL